MCSYRCVLAQAAGSNGALNYLLQWRGESYPTYLRTTRLWCSKLNRRSLTTSVSSSPSSLANSEIVFPRCLLPHGGKHFRRFSVVHRGTLRPPGQECIITSPPRVPGVCYIVPIPAPGPLPAIHISGGRLFKQMRRVIVPSHDNLASRLCSLKDRPISSTLGHRLQTRPGAERPVPLAESQTES